MTFLDIFLLLNAFLLGVVIVLAIQYGLAHWRNEKAPKAADSAPVPKAVRERIIKQAEENFQGIVNRSALQLQSDLGSTGTQLNKLLEKFGAEVLDDEMKLFRDNVAQIRASTQGSLSGAEDEITKQQTAILQSLATRQADLDAKLSQKQTELESQLEASFATQKEQLTARLNDKLSDAVNAFLLETLGHEVDLGAQSDYLVSVLEANKEQLIKGVVDET
ncbi:MAG TPA: hypothetical protein PK096_00225 [Candidatus Saccharibacteria bacterium]|nr:hypothetical protein [Candidatus Saccharibacteria bacterium]HRK93781.1 hypothetical protein [Candidatus Saccharibacteria bacterium]